MVEHNQSKYGSGKYDNAYKFNGKELDESTQMYYYGARYYDPRISIFVSVDPLAEKYVGRSPYEYCFNNPINLIDPTGMGPEEWRDKQGNLVYDAKKQEFTKNATSEHKQLAKELRKTTTGEQQFQKLVKSEYQTTIEVQDGKGPSTGDNYMTGYTSVTKVDGKIESIAIDIYKGRITDLMDVAKTYVDAKKGDLLPSDVSGLYNNTKNMAQKVAVVIGHEIEHAVNPDNTSETIPEEKEMKIINEYKSLNKK